MPQQNNVGLIRVGILALPIAALLVLIGMLGGLGTPDPGNDPTGAARAASTTGFFLAQFVSNVLGPTLVIFGLIALFAYLLDTRGGRLATLALVFSILGLCMLLSFLGIVVYVIPALSQEYLNGQQNAIQISEAIFGKAATVNILASVLYLIGFAFFGVAIWRSETLPKWAGVLLGVSGLILAVPVDSPILGIMGSILLLIAGAWISLGVLRRPPGAAEAQQPRVR